MRSMSKSWQAKLHSIRIYLLLFIAAVGAGIFIANAFAPAAEEPASLVLRGGRIVTLEAAQPEAAALAVRGEKIVAVGSEPEIRNFIGPSTRVVDLGGRLAIPGFIEGHGHFVSLGQSRMILDLTKARTWNEIVEMVGKAARSAGAGNWILGRGWHQEKWDRPPEPNVEGFPTHASLSAASPKNPVLLTHASGHAGFANALALERGGIGRSTPNPSGGEILRDASGKATGLLRETAQGLVRRALSEDQGRRSPAEREAEERRAIEIAVRECLSKGITSFQDAGSSFETIDRLKKIADEGALGLRLWVMIRASNDQLERKLAHSRLIGHAGGYLTVRALKHSIDGALGPRGAWLLEPYSDLPNSAGLNTTPVSTIERTAALALQHGFQLCVHAIGDRANRETLDLFERAFRSRTGSEDPRWRIEHAQHLHPADIPRFAKLQVIASMQGIHCTSDAVFVRQRLGEKRAREGAYVWQSLIRSGAVVINGTDVPVEDVDPIASYYASVSRRLANGTRFFPEQSMTRIQALRSYTLDAAYAAFEEQAKGSLKAGKLADITILSSDILRIPEEQIPSTKVDFTIVGGRVMYERTK